MLSDLTPFLWEIPGSSSAWHELNSEQLHRVMKETTQRVTHEIEAILSNWPPPLPSECQNSPPQQQPLMSNSRPPGHVNESNNNGVCRGGWMLMSLFAIDTLPRERVFLLVTQAYSDKVKKIRVLPTGVEPMTFRLVLRMLYHWATGDSW